MPTLEQFLASQAQAGTLNLLFDNAMYSLVNDLEQILKVLQSADVPFELVGGMAVNVHIMARERSRSFVTRDLDLLVQRADLERLIQAAEQSGYTAKKMMGGYMLLRPDQQPAEAVHLLFAGERSKTTQPLPHPELRPEDQQVFGLTVPVAPLRDLLVMKLNSFRPKDLVHLETLDEAGLITPDVEAELPQVLCERLTEARVIFAENKPDV